MPKQYIRAFRADEQPAAAPSEGGAIRFVASTEGIKRDGLEISSAGWQLDNYRKNPVVLWGHDYMTRPPIGRAEVAIDGDRLVADVTFDRADPFAAEVERKYRAGYLNAVSVGWESLEDSGQKVTRQDLLDISAVPVPGDPDALIQRQAAAMRAYLDGVMQPGADGDGQRMGAVLNARNRDALHQAVDLINAVLESAEKKAEADEDKESDEERALREIADRLQIK